MNTNSTVNFYNGEAQKIQTAMDKTPIAELRNIEISQLFNGFSHEDRKVIIPIGFPASGKTLLLSSLIYYAYQGSDINWDVKKQIDFPFDSGNLAADRMNTEFSTGVLAYKTPPGTVDIIGLDISVTKNGFWGKKQLPPLKLAFVDMAGGELAKIKTSESGSFPHYIKSVLDGLQYGKVIFALITPYESYKAHHEEDRLMVDFINYLQVSMPLVFARSKFVTVVSQWDRNPQGDKIAVEQFIAQKRPQLFNKIKNLDCNYGAYSVGNVLQTTDANGNLESVISGINMDYPSRFWKMLYQRCTGISI